MEAGEPPLPKVDLRGTKNRPEQSQAVKTQGEGA